MRAVKKYKLYSYQDCVQHDLDIAMKAIDTTTAQNRPMRNDDMLVDAATNPAADLLSGFGF